MAGDMAQLNHGRVNCALNVALLLFIGESAIEIPREVLGNE
jgi:hypothetical protein